MNNEKMRNIITIQLHRALEDEGYTEWEDKLDAIFDWVKSYRSSKETIRNWLRTPDQKGDKSMPPILMLKVLADKLEKPVDYFLEENNTNVQSDGVATITGLKYYGIRNKFLEEVETSLWILFRTGISLGWGDHRRYFENVIADPKVKDVRLLICPPKQITNDKNTIAYHNVIRDLIAIRRYSNTEREESVSDPITKIIRRFAEFSDKARKSNNDKHKVTVKTIAYIPAAVCYLREVKSTGEEYCEDGASVLATQSNFRLKFEDAPTIHAYKNKHPEVFSFYYRNFLQLWDSELAQSVNLENYL